MPFHDYTGGYDLYIKGQWGIASFVCWFFLLFTMILTAITIFTLKGSHTYNKAQHSQKGTICLSILGWFGGIGNSLAFIKYASYSIALQDSWVPLTLAIAFGCHLILGIMNFSFNWEEIAN